MSKPVINPSGMDPRQSAAIGDAVEATDTALLNGILSPAAAAEVVATIDEGMRQRDALRARSKDPSKDDAYLDARRDLGTSLTARVIGTITTDFDAADGTVDGIIRRSTLEARANALKNNPLVAATLNVGAYGVSEDSKQTQLSRKDRPPRLDLQPLPVKGEGGPPVELPETMTVQELADRLQLPVRYAVAEMLAPTTVLTTDALSAAPGTTPPTSAPARRADVPAAKR